MSIVLVRMQKEKPVMVSVSFFRSPTNFKKVCKKEGFDIGGEREYGVAQLFFPQQEIKRAQAKKMFEIIVEKEGLELLGCVQCRFSRRFSVIKRKSACRASCSIC